MKFCDAGLHGGLNKLAELLDVPRIGPQHQARLLFLDRACHAQ
jgi:CCR4-NOT transcription complex subunit 7/8